MPQSKPVPQPVDCSVLPGADCQSFAELTTMRVGGAFAELLVATTAAELADHAARLWETDEPWLLLGGGSNTVVSDAGFPGPVLLVRNRGIEVVPDPELPSGKVRVRAQAGQDWDALVAWTVERGYAGIEMLSGIPGLAGAAPVQNIGAYGGEIASTLHSVEWYDRELAEVQRVPASELALGYRDSVLKQGREAVILSIDLVLDDNSAQPDPLSAPIVFGQLMSALGVEQGARLPLSQVRETVLQVRGAKGMVLVADDHNSWSAGSFFTNPVVSASFARSLPDAAPKFAVDPASELAQVTTFDELAAGEDLPAPDFAAQQPRYKLSAAWLIDNAGIKKGFRLPGSAAAISDLHTLALTNRGGATAAEIGELARYVVSIVQSEFGIVLVPEPNVYGIEI